MVVCHKDRWVNKNKLANKTYFKQLLIQIYSREYPKENFSFGVYNVTEKRENV